MRINIPKTSIADEQVEISGVTQAPENLKRIELGGTIQLKRSRQDLTPEHLYKRQKFYNTSPTMSIDSDLSSTLSTASTLGSFTGFTSGLRPVTVKTYMQVAVDVETYRRLVNAGPETSSKVANGFQRIFRDYAARVNECEWGSKISRERRKGEKRIRLRINQSKLRHRQRMRELRLREAVMMIGTVDECGNSDVRWTRSVNQKYMGTMNFNEKESERLESVDAHIRCMDHLLELKYRPLTSSENKIIATTMNLPGPKIIQTRFGINMKISLLQCLTPGVWLNDEVINFWLGMTQERSNTRVGSPEYPLKHQAKVFIMNTFFWTKLYNKGVYTYKNVRRWTKKSKLRKIGVNSIFELDKFLFPIHVNKTHWCAGVINFKEKRFEYYDSLGGCHEKFFKFCRRFVFDEREKFGVDYSLKGFVDHCPQDAPHQNNGSDCGVFTLKFLEWACECRDPRAAGGFSQENMYYFRRRTLLEIIQGKLLDP